MEEDRMFKIINDGFAEWHDNFRREFLPASLWIELCLMLSHEGSFK